MSGSYKPAANLPADGFPERAGEGKSTGVHLRLVKHSEED